ncbi:MAG TPA: hypothetical protein DD649_11815 [Providencia sp.]|nr:hypothetical protein [Providencia sp.]HBO23561.1 hypothetical protein [Providencia sp.]
MANELVVIEKSTALEVFKSSDSVEDIIRKVEQEVNSFIPDVTTVKGRIGCPCCGHNEFHKVKSGGECEICSGTGSVIDAEFAQYCNESDFDVNEHIHIAIEVNNRFISLGII